MPPPRILFVDDDPLILRSIVRSLRTANSEWVILTSDDPARAIELLEREPIDVVVSDLNMTQIDGAALLVEVQRRRPDAVRIVLSAMVDPKQVFRTVPIAHQFITKPFEVGELRGRLARALDLRRLLQDPKLRALVGRDNALPPVPSTFAELSAVVTDPRAGVGEMARVVEKDTALTAELIRLVSSAYFGLPRQVHGVRGAIAYLGVEMLKALVLEVEIARTFRPSEVPRGFDIEALQQHALGVARAARRFANGTRHAEDAFTAGMLHDVGQLVLAARAPDETARSIEIAATRKVPLAEAEREILGVSHAEVGAFLLGLWGVKQSLVEAVALHHDSDEESTAEELVRVLRAAERECADDAPRAGPGVLSRRLSGFVPTGAPTSGDGVPSAAQEARHSGGTR